MDAFREEFSQRPRLRRLIKTLYQVEMVISVTTEYQEGTEVEYATFNRLIWLKDKYFGAA